MQQHINQTITKKLWSGGDADARQIISSAPLLQPLPGERQVSLRACVFYVCKMNVASQPICARRDLSEGGCFFLEPQFKSCLGRHRIFELLLNVRDILDTGSRLPESRVPRSFGSFVRCVTQRISWACRWGSQDAFLP